MSLTLHDNVRNGMADAITTRIDSGAAAGRLRIYGGGSGRPANPSVAITDQTLLAEFTLADPSFGAAAAGVITLDADPDLTTTGLAAGTADWARFTRSDAAAGAAGEVDVNVGTSGTDLNLNTLTISVGVNVTITSGTITVPVGTAD